MERLNTLSKLQKTAIGALCAAGSVMVGGAVYLDLTSGLDAEERRFREHEASTVIADIFGVDTSTVDVNELELKDNRAAGSVDLLGTTCKVAYNVVEESHRAIDDVIVDC